jgi:RNA polymerase sigma factor (sigma-70 family)
MAPLWTRSLRCDGARDISPYVLEDAELIRRSVDDPKLFEEIFHRHHDVILRYARQRLGHDVGEEIAARTLVIAFDQRARFDARYRSARPWLFGIATNLIRHHLRDERVHLTALARLPIDPELDESDVLDRLDALRRRPLLLQAFLELPPIDRDAFALLALSGLTYAEIAKALDVPEGTVGSRIHRARRFLRERIRGLEASTEEAGAAGRSQSQVDADE